MGKGGHHPCSPCCSRNGNTTPGNISHSLLTITPSTSAERQRVKTLEREVKELRKANEIWKLASAFFAQAALDRPFQVLRAFIDAHWDTYGVELICMVLQIAPSGYRRYAAQQRNPELRCEHNRL